MPAQDVVPAYLFARQSTVVKANKPAKATILVAVTSTATVNSIELKQSKSRRGTKTPRYAEQVTLGHMLSRLFPGCNQLWAAKVMGVTKGNAKQMLFGHRRLNRERALRIVAALERMAELLPLLQELADRPQIDPLGRSWMAYDPVTSRYRDTRVARGRIRPQHATHADDDPGQPT